MKNPIGDKIKEVRQRKNLSQAEVAERLNISQSTYAKIEQGASRMDVDRLMALAEIFETEVHELLPHSDYKQVQFNHSQMKTGFVEHFYEASKEAYEQHIKHLKEEIDFLRTMIRQQGEGLG